MVIVLIAVVVALAVIAFGVANINLSKKSPSVLPTPLYSAVYSPTPTSTSPPTAFFFWHQTPFFSPTLAPTTSPKTEKAKTTNSPYPSSVASCSLQSSNFICSGVTEGVAFSPSFPPPIVCGCVTKQCEPGEILITNYEPGTWPDGSQKGSFTCSEEYPP